MKERMAVLVAVAMMTWGSAQGAVHVWFPENYDRATAGTVQSAGGAKRPRQCPIRGPGGGVGGDEERIGPRAACGGTR